MRTRSAHIALAIALAVAVHTRPAHAAWSPDSVLTLGFAGQHTIEAGFFPTGTSDMYVWWRWSSNSIVTYVDRVTSDGGLVFSKNLNSLGSPGATPDGLGGLMDAWSVSLAPNNSDIAFQRVMADGTTLPSVSNYWAAQTPARDIFPALASDPSGGAYIGWVDFSGRTTLQRVTALGGVAAGWPAAGRRLTSTSSTIAGPALLPDGAGGTYVLYATDLARLERVNPDTTLATGWPAGGLALGLPGPYYVTSFEYPSDLSLVASGADHVFAVWSEVDGTTGRRIMVQWVSSAGGVEWSELELLPITAGVGRVEAQPDGQGGLLVSWFQSGAFEVAHVLTDQSVVGPFEANPSGLYGGALTHGRDGGFIVFRADPSGILATWYRSDGSLDPAEPVNPRLVHPHVTDHPAYPTGALSDDDGGAFLVLNEELGPFFEEEKMRHVFRTGALDAGPLALTRLALSISPNPARRNLGFDLRLADDAPARLEVLDVTGRLVLSRVLAGGRGARHEVVELPAGTAPGVYLARVTQAGESRIRRFVTLD